MCIRIRKANPMYSSYIHGVCDDDDDDGDDDVLIKHGAMLCDYSSGIELLAATHVHMYVCTYFICIHTPT